MAEPVPDEVRLLPYCTCMDGPNEPAPTCLYCGGTGTYVSDERLATLRKAYALQVMRAASRQDFTLSDKQHVAIFAALQIARRAIVRPGILA